MGDFTSFANFLAYHEVKEHIMVGFGLYIGYFKRISNLKSELPINFCICDRAQVVGWPPIRSFRKNTLATSSKKADPLFVKVSMNGAPYLRKVDLRTYATYQELSSGLEKMFSCFTLGKLLLCCLCNSITYQLVCVVHFVDS